ncbi:MAG TPA: hypothetical protein VJ975_06535 [Candidatus Limnocylindria bacterium]|nr:hypothetical protein [Candidatus Limnocylindria bacterium]
MLIPNHPADERLSALAFGDTDATADTSLTGHVSTCIRCTDLVNELGALRASLAELPDISPSRPLRLLPPVEAQGSTADRLGGWARRFFAPVLTAGAALALVGLVGTTTPAFQGESIFQDAGSELSAQASMALEAPAADGGGALGGATAPSAEPEAAGGEALSGTDAVTPAESNVERALSATGDDYQDADEGAGTSTPAPAERSPWPMILFTGVALMVAAALLRWILAPRAG